MKVIQFTIIVSKLVCNILWIGDLVFKGRMYQVCNSGLGVCCFNSVGQVFACSIGINIRVQL